MSIPIERLISLGIWPASRGISQEISISNLEQLVASLQGRGGPVKAYPISDTSGNFPQPPTQESLLRWFMVQIWGDGGIFIYDSDNPANTVYDISGNTHLGSDVFNGTWAINSIDSEQWVLVNTPDTTPVVFDIIDVGKSNIGIANEQTAGVVKSGGDILVSENGIVTIPALIGVEAALSAI